MSNMITRPVSAMMVMVYGNDIAHKALILAGKLMRVLFT